MPPAAACINVQAVIHSTTIKALTNALLAFGMGLLAQHGGMRIGEHGLHVRLQAEKGS